MCALIKGAKLGGVFKRDLDPLRCGRMTRSPLNFLKL